MLGDAPVSLGRYPDPAWTKFRLGIRPGIHPSRWPAWVPRDILPILSSDPRIVDHLFATIRTTGLFPDADPGDAGHPVAAPLVRRPEIIPVLHGLVSAASGLDLLSRAISARERSSIDRLFGHEIHSEAMYVLPRLNLPDLGRWFATPLPGESLPEILAARGGRVLMAALHGSEDCIRKMILTSLPVSAGGDIDLASDGEDFRRDARTLVLSCMDHVMSRSSLSGRN